MIDKVYVETSVIGHLTSWPSQDVAVAGHQVTTRKWWDTAKDRFELFVSELVVRECEAGDPHAAQERLDALNDLALLPITTDAKRLAKALVHGFAVPPTEPEDALHVALAAAHGVEYLVTWNFRHIANAAMVSKIEDVCRQEGFEPPVICSPEQLMESEDE
jgi:predicted nucleic acid-binding protein